jgi:putative addiction module component (TIGR02574 family)
VMTADAEKLMSDLVQLSNEDRAEIAYKLFRTLEPTSEASDEELTATLNRRSRELADGTVKGIPADEVFARIRQKHGFNAI